MSVLFPKTLTVSRPNDTFVNGIATDGTATTITFKGNVQPLSNRDMVALNIGRADLGKIAIYCDTILGEGRLGGPLKGDRIVFSGQTYEIIQENVHDNGILPHEMYIAELRELDA